MTDNERVDATSGNNGLNRPVVEKVQVPGWANDLLLRRAGEADLLILPRRVEAGRGEYQDADLPGVRDLYTSGVRVDWAHAESDRVFISQYSAAHSLATVGMFVAQTIAQENVGAIYWWLLGRFQQAVGGHHPGKEEPPFSIEVDRIIIKGDRREIEGLRVSGRDERVIDVAMALVRGEQIPNE